MYALPVARTRLTSRRVAERLFLESSGRPGPGRVGLGARAGERDFVWRFLKPRRTRAGVSLFDSAGFSRRLAATAPGPADTTGLEIEERTVDADPQVPVDRRRWPRRRRHPRGRRRTAGTRPAGSADSLPTTQPAHARRPSADVVGAALHRNSVHLGRANPALMDSDQELERYIAMGSGSGRWVNFAGCWTGLPTRCGRAPTCRQHHGPTLWPWGVGLWRRRGAVLAL